jgi:hypothetical protein
MGGVGPAPKPDNERRRRNATVAMTQLPAEGRQGEPPRFPLLPYMNDDEPNLEALLRDREAALWAELWATPQAVMWERTHSELTVARFTRFSVLAETGNLKAATEARQLEDRLGLNPQAMLRLRWQVAADEVADQRQERTERTRAAGSARSRLKVVDTKAAGAG